MIRKQLLSMAVMLFGTWLAAAASPGDLKSPELVKTSLRIFAGVYADMSRKLAAQQFDRLPHENQEFQEGAQAMRDAIAGEPAVFKAKVEPVLSKTLAASAHVADVSKSHDATQVTAALGALADSMKDLNALFPEGLRTLPGTVGPPHGP